MGKILITGASGHLGSATISFLLKAFPSQDIVAFARDRQKVHRLQEQGVEIRIGNFDDDETLDQAMHGIEKVLLVSGLDANRLEQHRRVVDAAVRNNVRHILYTGVAFKDIASSAIRDFMDAHFLTEDYIIGSGLSYTFFRNSLYADAIPMFAGQNAVEQGIFLPAGTAKVPFALRMEIAEAIANVLLFQGHEGKIYHITGGRQFSFSDIAKLLSELSGKEVNYTDADPAGFPAVLSSAGIPAEAVFIISGFAKDIKNGQYEIESKDLEHLIGRKPAELKDLLREFYHL